MSTTTQQHADTFAGRIAAPLGALRGRVRRYVWFEGLGLTVAAAGGLFWLSLVIDWFFEPPVVVRVVLLAAGLIAIGIVVATRLVQRLQHPLSDENMAMLLERRFPDLDDALLTSISLRAEPSEGLGGEMLARTSREAAGRVAEADLGDVFNQGPLRRAVAGAAVLVASIVLFALISPQSVGTWARRSVLMSHELWPRRTELAVEGFDGGVCKVARGASLEIAARANLDKPLVPNSVEVRYRTKSGARGEAAMNRDGDAVPGRDSFQRYTHTFRSILSPIEFDLVGGDARIDDLRIEVVESPKVESLTLLCRYPAYMDRPTRRIPVVGPTRVPRHTEVTIEGVANKPLVDVQVDRSSGESVAEPVSVKPIDEAGGGRGFRFVLGPLAEDVTLQFTPRDVDGIESTEPTRLVLVAAPDESPEVSVGLSGIGSAITPRARVPVVGTVRDDHGIASVWFEHAVGDAEAVRAEVVASEGNPTELPVDTALDVRELGLKPGQKFSMRLVAADRCDVEPSHTVGAGQRWQLDVVTPDALRIMLQSRELTLRHRFEQIIEEVAETRDTLVRIGPEGEAAKSTSSPSEEKKRAAGAEPGDEPGEVAAASTEASNSDERERRLAAATLRCQRAVQNSRKNANETLGVAEAFDDIRWQLINNRIDTEELKIRLKSGVADPLRVIGEEMFPELDRRLAALGEVLDDEGQLPARRDAAREQVDEILTAMNAVLSRMMELEDFNEVIMLLREIIGEQQKLEKETRRRHKSQLRELLEGP